MTWLSSPRYVRWLALLQIGRPASFDTSRLTAKEHLLLSYLQAHADGVCEKDDLIWAVWPEDQNPHCIGMRVSLKSLNVCPRNRWDSCARFVLAISYLGMAIGGLH
jgi:hypothetical protein